MFTDTVILHLTLIVTAIVIFVVGAMVARSNMHFERKVRLHKTLIGIGTLFIIIALVRLLVEGNFMTNISHFYVGIIALILFFLTILGGLIALKAKEAEKKKKMRNSHKFDAIIFFILMIINVVVGFLFIL